MIFSKKACEIELRISRSVLENVFDECDRHDRDETGGKIIGTFVQRKGKFDILVCGVIDAGPNTRRTPTSLFQDGEYQAQMFRAIESQHPEVEHLGTWHSHHVNGYPELSSGDIETYRRVVNHELHNPPFFYALLVVSRSHGDLRYKVKHYVLFRGQQAVFEIPSRNVRIVDTPRVWLPTIGKTKGLATRLATKGHSEFEEGNAFAEVDCRHWYRLGYVADQPRETDAYTAGAFHRILKDLYADLAPFYSPATSSIYWKGTLQTIDGANAQVRVFQVEQNGQSGFVASMMGSSRFASRALRTAIRPTPFQAVHELERELNNLVFASRVTGNKSIAKD